MKTRKFHLFVAILLLSVMLFTSCAGSNFGAAADGGGSTGGGYMSGGIVSGAPSDTEIEGDVDESAPDSDDAADSTDKSEKEDKTESENTRLPAGLITAAAWNDNDNYQAFLSLFTQGEDSNGKFVNYSGDKAWGFTSLHRIKVNVNCADAPVAGAKVTAIGGDGKVLYKAVTDASGVAYLFTDAESGTVSVTSGDATSTAQFTADSRELSITLDSAGEKANIIDIMFVIDVTGSMGDELRFLQNEIDDVVSRVVAKNEGTVINISLLFYRDSVDAEEFDYHDFVNVTAGDGLAKQKAALASQSASGGGDYPESVDEALELAVGKQWSSAATTKLIFHVLDAPPHSKNEDKTRYNAAVESAAEKGIRICPILCSGADYLTEYLTRQAAISTGGTFIFVTDDSGIGNSHHDPSLPNVTVEALNSLLVRIISGYHTGTFDAPVSWRDQAAQG